MVDLATSRAATPAAPRPATRRVVFVDLARALAVLFMLYGHAMSALFAPEYLAGPWFELWQFQRGLTASLFLLLAGFAFSLATVARWRAHLALSPHVVTRLRRFVFYILLGYGLRFPVGRVFALAGATDAQWRSFLAVDILQLIGTTFVVVQLLVLITRSPRAFALTSIALATGIVAVTPAVWRVAWDAHLPLWAASFLSPATGSLFPLFPSAGFVLLGCALGHAYTRWDATRPLGAIVWVLLGPGLLLCASGWALRPYQIDLFGGGGGSWVPPETLIRAGACLLIVAVIAFASRSLSRLPPAVAAVAQESLLIYFVHVCIVYGSVWNPGLDSIFGSALGPASMLLVVLALVTSMVLLAWAWHRTKRLTPVRARWIAAAAAAAMVLRLV